MKRTERYRIYRKEVSEYTRENAPAPPRWPGDRPTLDHIVPISKAFQWGIPPELVGSRENLTWIGRNANIGKGARITKRATDLIRKWGYRDLADVLEERA